MCKKPHAKRPERGEVTHASKGEAGRKAQLLFQYAQTHNPLERVWHPLLESTAPAGAASGSCQLSRGFRACKHFFGSPGKNEAGAQQTCEPLRLSWGAEECRCWCWVAGSMLLLCQKGGSHLLTPLLADSLGCAPTVRRPLWAIPVLGLHGKCIFKASPLCLAGSGWGHWHLPQAAGIWQQLLGLSGLCSSLGTVKWT